MCADSAHHPTSFPGQLLASLNDRARLSHTSLPLTVSFLCLERLTPFPWAHPAKLPAFMGSQSSSGDPEPVRFWVSRSHQTVRSLNGAETVPGTQPVLSKGFLDESGLAEQLPSAF